MKSNIRSLSPFLTHIKLPYLLSKIPQVLICIWFDGHLNHFLIRQNFVVFKQWKKFIIGCFNFRWILRLIVNISHFLIAKLSSTDKPVLLSGKIHKIFLCKIILEENMFRMSTNCYLLFLVLIGASFLSCWLKSCGMFSWDKGMSVACDLHFTCCYCWKSAGDVVYIL